MRECMSSKQGTEKNSLDNQEEKKYRQYFRHSNSGFVEKLVPKLLLITALVSIVTTLGIVATLLFETVHFFTRVPIMDFLTDTSWLPWNEETGTYGILALISGTLLTTAIALIVAIPVGLSSALYLSEFASERTRKILKPVLEVLAGIPSIVYGFFALTFVTPMLQQIIPGLQTFNALSPGIVMGIMIIPIVASMSEDAMSAVPVAIREGALAMGATRLEVALNVVLPAAISGVIASFVLAFSRAIGETMIVSIAAGASPSISLNFLEPTQTMTAYIAQVTTGDAGYGTTIYYSIYAVGMTLFIFTYLTNMLAGKISRRFREEY